MKNKTRIAILGIGGVGGYFGGKLAAKYRNSDDFEIIFIARGENKKVIKEDGLTLITPDNEARVFPHIVTDNPVEIGPIDYLVCSVKSYHLESALAPLRDCITEATVILPLLNGVDASERIKKLYPQVEVWEGCVYIMVRLTEPGVIKEHGSIHQFHFGSVDGTQEKLTFFEETLMNAELETYLSDNIEQTIWDKFLLISTIASLTSYLNLTIQEIFEIEKHRETLQQLMNELKSVGEAKGIQFSTGIVEKTLAILKKTPPGTTSSMHSDFIRGGQTEKKSLTEYIVEEGSKLNIPTPTYLRISNSLSQKHRD